MRRVILTILAAVILAGCKAVRHEERVEYEDGSAVTFARVYEVGTDYVGITTTDSDGSWQLWGPPGVRVQLCIENPRSDYNLVCWDEVERREFLRFPTLTEEPHLQRSPYVEENHDGNDSLASRIYDEWVRYRR